MDKETKEEIGQLKANFDILKDGLRNLEYNKEREKMRAKREEAAGISNFLLALAFLFFFSAAWVITDWLWLHLLLMGAVLVVASKVVADSVN